MRDVSHWSRSDISRGSREGYWLENPGNPDDQRVLIKFPRQRTSFTTGEIWAEYLAANIGQEIELAVPTVDIVTYDGRQAVLIEDFMPPGYELREGAQLTGTLREVKRATLEQVRDALAAYVGMDEALRTVVHMVCFDILIGNSDRHQANWGVLLSPLPDHLPHMAPFYDHGAAFGSNLDPTRVQRFLETGLDAFHRGFRYEICVARNQRPRTSELLECLKAWDSTLSGIGPMVLELTDASVATMVNEISPLITSEEHRSFAKTLVRDRRELILSVLE